ncbi:MAG: bifunctional cytidylyltransferase/SDR family oxidoreductase [Micrococcaceae bacterium]
MLKLDGAYCFQEVINYFLKTIILYGSEAKVDKEMKNIGIILAAGSGTRLGAHIPKQFLRVAGREIIDYTLEAFQNNENIDEIIVMSNPDFVERTEKISKNYSKVTAVLSGGKTRNATSNLAIEHIGQESNLIFHDAVRPFVSNRIINDSISALEDYNAVDVAIPSADTIIQVDNNEILHDIPKRDALRRGQTPQAFKWSTIKHAYELAIKDDTFTATDDCGVIKQYLPDEKIYVVAGEENNIKITHTLDLAIADKLFQLKTAESKKFDEDYYFEKLNGKTMVVFGGSYGIGAEIINIAEKYGANCFSFSRSETETDICDEASVKEALDSVIAKQGQIDYIVNTAGSLYINPLADTDTKTIQEMINVNFTAAAVLASFAKNYLKNTHGQLLLFTSSSYTRGRENYSLYSASKAAIVNMVQALSDEWSSEVRINCINPARTATPMRTKAFGEENPDTLLSASEVASASVETLISDFTGQIIDVVQNK